MVASHFGLLGFPGGSSLPPKGMWRLTGSLNFVVRPGVAKHLRVNCRLALTADRGMLLFGFLGNKAWVESRSDVRFTRWVIGISVRGCRLRKTGLGLSRKGFNDWRRG